MQPSISRKPVALAVIAVLSLNGCVTTNPQTGQPSIKETFKQTFASDDPCANNTRNIGMVAGALLGAVIGRKVADGNNKALGTVLGVGLGGALGALIGSEVDKRQCELAKIQKKHGLDMQVTPIAVETKAAQTSDSEASNSSSAQTSTQRAESATPQKVGLSVSVVDQAGRPQFLSSSDELQPEAKVQFAEIARQYSAEQAVADMGLKTEDEKQKVADALRKKRVLLIGHTDDTGNSRLNADLSERRAKEVAKLFKASGVSEDQLFYQGAGETLPRADNATEEGRAKNRRVEIVDLSDDDTFQLYLQNRRPNTAYYRPVETIDKPVPTASTAEAKPASSVAEKKSKATTKAKAGKIPAVAGGSEPVPNNRKPMPGFIDFGGTPFTKTGAIVDIGEVAKNKSGFTLIGEAHADAGPILSCDRDRPRNAGEVKALKDGKAYATREYLPGVYDSSWAGKANGHLIALTHVAVLRDGAIPARKPELMVYRDFKGDSQAKPNYKGISEVNAYRGDKALLYRVFSDGPVRCMDVVIPNNAPLEAPNSSILYERGNALYSAPLNAKIAK